MANLSARLLVSRTPVTSAFLGFVCVSLLVGLASCDNKANESLELCRDEVAKQFPEADFDRQLDLQTSVLQAVRTCMEARGMVFEPTADCHLTVVELNRFCYRPK
jgi:hypothetical protein